MRILQGNNYGKLMTKLRKEEHMFGDILIAKLKEAYYNMSLKTWIGMVFAKKFCKKIECFMKSDSDNILNLRNIHDLCMENRSKVERKSQKEGFAWEI